jgi:hypothetical protein
MHITPVQLARLPVSRSLAHPGSDCLEMMELAIRTAMTRLGAALLEGLLAADAGHRGPRVDCGHGHEAAFVAYRAKTIGTVPGPADVRRAYYHCAECGHGVIPKDGQLGITGASMSPGLRKMTARAAAALPFAKAAGLLAELAGLPVTAKRAERSAETDGTAGAARIAAEAEAICSRQMVPLPPPTLPDMLYIAIDGTGIPMVPAATRDRPGKAGDGRARTREIKLACLFTQASTDDDGWPVRDPGSSSYLATFEPAQRFGQLMEAEARRRGAAHIRQLVVLGDGAVWIWNLAARHFPALLTAGRDLKLIGSLGRQRDTALGYFETNAHRMHYARFRTLGMFVGSGTVEAACRTIGQRLKLSGMRWDIPGATGIATPRCQEASGRWEQGWQRPHNQTGAA